mgnify:CR=1 FL=1|tara:strand:- start:14 stop:406 length:393 start_codon:yes stop_codon:yes gene_type:complete
MNTGERVGIASIVLVGSIVGFTASGVLGAFSDGYFLGRERKKGVTYKNIARRNAILGGAFGAIGAASVLFGNFEKKEAQETQEQLFGIGAISKRQQNKLNKIEAELRKASKMHASQADRISQISGPVNVF